MTVGPDREDEATAASDGAAPSDPADDDPTDTATDADDADSDTTVAVPGDAPSVPRSLRSEERAWIVASYGDWEFVDPPAPEPPVERPRPYPEPEPVTVVPGVDEAAAARLAEGGVVSVRVLAAADPVRVATALDLHANRVTSWHWWARSHVDADPLSR